MGQHTFKLQPYTVKTIEYIIITFIYRNLYIVIVFIMIMLLPNILNLILINLYTHLWCQYQHKLKTAHLPRTVLQKILLGALKWYGPRLGLVFIRFRRNSRYFTVIKISLCTSFKINHKIYNLIRLLFCPHISHLPPPSQKKILSYTIVMDPRLSQGSDTEPISKAQDMNLF